MRWYKDVCRHEVLVYTGIADIFGVEGFDRPDDACEGEKVK